jgi:nicotinate-nucleotide pyrophosphorylase (carboxylating)
LVGQALLEDLQGGDLTTLATVASDLQGTARAIAKQDLVLSGSEVFREVHRRIDPELSIDAHVSDGALVAAGAPLFRVSGRVHSILQAERTALNFVQRMSGVATLTCRYVSALPENSKTRIADTRKTTPLLRALEREAVRAGGGYNHRDNLGAAVLIKDNHVVAAGGVKRAVELARAYAPHTSKVEVEIDSLDQLAEALEARADVILLDNFSDTDVKSAVRWIDGRAIVEVSGGITLERVPLLAELGVDVISVGALTHSAPAVDISLELAF